MTALDLFETHRERLDRAGEACRTRGSWSPFADQPSRYPDYENARSAGEAAFNARLGQTYAIAQPPPLDQVGEEISPYTQKPLGILYPRSDLDALFTAAAKGIATWSAATPHERAGVLLEVIDRIYRSRLFELTYAVMHTTGQQTFHLSGIQRRFRGQ